MSTLQITTPAARPRAARVADAVVAGYVHALARELPAPRAVALPRQPRPARDRRAHVASVGRRRPCERGRGRTRRARPALA